MSPPGRAGTAVLGARRISFSGREVMQMKRWIESKEYQLQTEEWVPCAHVIEVIPGGLEAHHVTSNMGLRFKTREEARAHSQRLGEMWVASNT